MNLCTVILVPIRKSLCISIHISQSAFFRIGKHTNIFMSAGKKICSSINRTIVYIFNKHLFTINTFTGSLLMCTGDIVQQNVEQYHGLSDSYDWKRTARITTVGSILGSMQYFFYRSLDKRYPARDIRTIAKKIVIDQTICTPINIFVFIYGLGLLENTPWAKMNEEFRHKFLVIFSVDCAVFVPSQYINFKFVDPKYRLVFVNMVSIMYDTFLSYIKYTHDILKSMKKQNNNDNN